MQKRSNILNRCRSKQNCLLLANRVILKVKFTWSIATRLPYNLYCVGGDVKPCSIQSNWVLQNLDISSRRRRGLLSMSLHLLSYSFTYLLCGCVEGMKLIMDFTPNQTSRNHWWFNSSRSSTDTGDIFRDFYVWRHGRSTANGSRLPPNDWVGSSGCPLGG